MSDRRCHLAKRSQCIWRFFFSTVFFLRYGLFCLFWKNEAICSLHCQSKINQQCKTKINCNRISVKGSGLSWYSSVPNKRTCTPYLISTKLPPCTLLLGTASLSIFFYFCQIFRPNLEKIWEKLDIFRSLSIYSRPS